MFLLYYVSCVYDLFGKSVVFKKNLSFAFWTFPALKKEAELRYTIVYGAA